MKQALSIFLILFLVLVVITPQTAEAGWFKSFFKAITNVVKAVVQTVAKVVQTAVEVAKVVIHETGCLVGGAIDPLVPWDAKCKKPSTTSSEIPKPKDVPGPGGGEKLSASPVTNPSMNFAKDEPTNSTVATVQNTGTPNPNLSLELFPLPQVISGKTLDLRPTNLDVAVNSIPISGNKFDFRVWLPNQVPDGTMPFKVRIADINNKLLSTDIILQLTVTSGVLKSTSGGSDSSGGGPGGDTSGGTSDSSGGTSGGIPGSGETGGTSPVIPTFNLSVLKTPNMSFVTNNPGVSSEGTVQISGSFSGSAILSLVTSSLSDGKATKNLSLVSSTRLNDLFKFKFGLSGKLTTKSYPVTLRVTDGAAFKDISVSLQVTSVEGGESER